MNSFFQDLVDKGQDSLSKEQKRDLINGEVTYRLLNPIMFYDIDDLHDLLSEKEYEKLVDYLKQDWGGIVVGSGIYENILGQYVIDVLDEEYKKTKTVEFHGKRYKIPSTYSIVKAGLRR